MSNFNWGYPNTVWFGNGRIKDLPKACKILKINKPLLVTDKDLVKTKMVQETLEINKRANLLTSVFSDLKGNPLGSHVKRGVEIFKNGNYDGIIAFGGGSSLDVGKSIVLQASLNRPLWDFTDGGSFWIERKFSESMAVNRISNSDNIVPTIAIPTTAGTGSETSRAAAIINDETKVKKIIFHPRMLPTLTILDPKLTVGMPPFLTAVTGMDAFAHNLEAYCAPGFHPMADGIALEGMLLIKKWLEIAVKERENLEARANMLASSSMGATAFQKGLGAIHSLSHPVNSMFDVHHGLSNGIFMPYVLTFNRSTIENKIAKLSGYLELKKASFNSFVDWVLDLRNKIKIPHKLSECVEITGTDIEKLSPMALNDPCTYDNPRKITLNDTKLLYQYSVEGKLF
ncbi:MAG: iron-containing alcohol dehydrogenase [Pelagibacteraceae bacterium]|jgi:alcohol dehydrogenase class IV|nr:iron-containing alcohol dehydrogenase [Pelagibacteraceae bacterium]MDP6709987.1 iron-containing alcohol dehydrogenase [Pelagibacteraceae bacterium]|tara:strand:- start:4764 stop:5963 length:1200 start_codon:yes stop_codon:yes gene_type:complete